jgi:hypothetical protein
MLNHLVAALVAISLTACAVAPRQHATSPAAAGQTAASTEGSSIVSADARLASEDAIGGSPDVDAPLSAPTGPARVIAAVLLMAIFVVAIVAGAQSAGRSIARSCCNGR